MTNTALHALLFAGIVLLAGCTGGLSGVPEASNSDADQPSEPTAAPTDAGTVAFYISDEENAIGDFQHLEVTVTRVGFERAAADDGGWVEFDVDNETVDLTQVQGDNATLVDEFDLPNGTYTKVFVHVGKVNGTLHDGTQVTVKLPSEKLQIKKRFSLANGSTVDFVFDITVHKAGKSGKYILTPVVSESGTDVPINTVGQGGDGGALSVELVGAVSQGGTATIEVTHEGKPVDNATVAVDDTEVGTTAADGRLTVDLPDKKEVEITAKKADMEGDLELEFTEADNGNEQDTRGPDAELNATFLTNVTQGEDATIQVTRNGSPVENATVTVNDEVAGTTDATGAFTFVVPDEESLTVLVEAGDEEVELEREFEADEES